MTTRNRDEVTLPVRLLGNPAVDRMSGVTKEQLGAAAIASNRAQLEAYDRNLVEIMHVKRLAVAALVVAIAALLVSGVNLYLTLQTFHMVERVSTSQGVIH